MTFLNFDLFFYFRHQKNKLKLDDVPKLPEWQRLRYQHSSVDMTVPNLVIRRASVVQGPLGYDLMGRKNSAGEICYPLYVSISWGHSKTT